MIIAVDFDGTIVEHRYPQIGEEIPFAVETLKMLVQDRHKLILWSVREGELLEEAVNNPHFSRKLKADIFIDDRNLGGLPDWGTMYRMIKHHKKWHHLIDEAGHSSFDDHRPPKKKHWWQF